MFCIRVICSKMCRKNCSEIIWLVKNISDTAENPRNSVNVDPSRPYSFLVSSERPRTSADNDQVRSRVNSASQMQLNLTGLKLKPQ